MKPNEYNCIAKYFFWMIFRHNLLTIRREKSFCVCVAKGIVKELGIKLYVFRRSAGLKLDRWHRLTLSLTHGSFSFFSNISVVMDRLGRSLQFCHLEFNKEAINYGCRSKNARYWRGFWNFKYCFSWASVVLVDLVFSLP